MVKQLAHLDRMHDEGRAVDLSVLIRVACGRELERSPHDREAARPVGGAVGDVIVEDALGRFSDLAHDLAAVSA